MGDRVIEPWQGMGDRAIVRRVRWASLRSPQPDSVHPLPDRAIAHALPWLDHPIALRPI